MPHGTEPHGIETVTVIGAGTMGAAIAGHLANAGRRVHLLDIIPRTLTADEQAAGLTLQDPAVRNRIVQAGYTRMVKARPSNLFAADVAQRIQLGNLEDDLAAAAQSSDWIIEAIVEQLEPKQALMKRLEELAPAHAIISTNTSGIPIAQISAGRSVSFQQRFLGTHFFNPPRYLPLLEIIPTPATDPAITQRMRAFVEEALGKNVVICHDTPNFIANRMVSYIMADLIAYAVEHGYTVEEVDALTGPLLGRPRSGTFRLNDVVGIDVWAMIARNLHPLIPDDADRDTLIAPAYLTVLQTLIDHGHLGSKSDQGFYQTQTTPTGEKSFWGLDLAAARTGEVVYQPPQNPTWPEVEAVQRLPLAERLPKLVALQNPAGQLLWHTLSHTLAYAAARFPEIADNLVDIDRAMQWGFAWELGPFALWDALDVAATTARMTNEGISFAPWVQRMLEQGHTTFYREHKGMKQVYHPPTERYVDVQQDPRVQTVAALKARHPQVAGNEAATLLEIGDGLLLLEFHTKMNALDSALFPILESAINQLHGSASGLIIANDGPHFSVGANLRALLSYAEAGNWAAIDLLIAQGQAHLLALRAAPKPVVAAPFQRVLGGGAEICLAAHRVVAHAETAIGLVEFNVGLIPGWGGCKEMVRRHVRADAPLDGLRHVMALITQAKVSASAHDAKNLGLLAADDRVVMHRDHLIHVARETALELAQQFTPTATTGNIYAAGAEALAALQEEIHAQAQNGKFLEHDVIIATALAHVLCGGKNAAAVCNEQDILDLERQHLLQLIRTPATQERIRQILATGKPLRN
ncbi:MAG: 3-hydroxyacyl-CoA dehydrogenase/enoyl-CoA hydratase family protein [Caldilineaceae bacterium]|nr:3-hydroxyacyl-CoA dehydrogenase/enoyl-CoA hydratase family protein [Caldilineaceae bacterium]